MEKYYVCDMCHETHEKGWSDEEAAAEAKELWGIDNVENNPNTAIVCDDCFEKIHPSKFPELAEKARQEITNSHT